MNFHYDPILGLQYSNLGFHIELDIAQIPKDFNFNIKKYFDIIQQQGIMIIDSKNIEYKTYSKITSNLWHNLN